MEGCNSHDSALRVSHARRFLGCGETRHIAALLHDKIRVPTCCTPVANMPTYSVNHASISALNCSVAMRKRPQSRASESSKIKRTGTVLISLQLLAASACTIRTTDAESYPMHCTGAASSAPSLNSTLLYSMLGLDATCMITCLPNNLCFQLACCCIITAVVKHRVGMQFPFALLESKVPKHSITLNYIYDL